ncbi:MAG: MbnH family di-heme enzyme [Vicinamibacterales bacterium]
MMRRLPLAGVLLWVVVATGVAARQAGAPPASAELTDRDLDAGGREYVARCAGCHGERGDGGLAAADRPGRRDLVALVRAARTDGAVADAIGASRPAHRDVFAGLDAAARRHLVAWVRSLGGVRLTVRATDGGAGYAWDLPRGFPQPKVPADNPMTPAKVELGRHLFYDTRLSVDGTFSCGTCHQQRLAFTDGKARAVGVTGEVHPRGAMGLANIAYSPVLTWANPTVRRLEAQALVPMFGDDPVELGLSGKEQELLARLAAEPRYPAMFAAAFPDQASPITLASVTTAIASFERTLLSGRSPYDLYRTSADPRALAPAAQRGEDLFFSERLACFQCHGGFTFSSAVDYVGKGPAEIGFHNTGLYNLGDDGGYPSPNTGVHAVTAEPEDMGRFKAPSLRNIALTAPYMHDGSLRTLDEVIRHYEAGGRTVPDGPLKGIGADNPRKSEFVTGFTLNDEERADLVAFLESLTDRAFTSDARFADPWPQKTGARGSGLGAAERRP